MEICYTSFKQWVLPCPKRSTVYRPGSYRSEHFENRIPKREDSMKKRVLSMILTLILCFSTLPMTALAQEADVVTEQGDPAKEQEEQQQEQQQVAAPVEPTAESISDSDAGTQDTGADDEKKAAMQKVQALINALPETVTVENAESVSAQLEAIDEAMAELTEEQIAELNMTRLHAISEAMNAPMTVAEQHTHCICGKDHHAVGEHTEESVTPFTQKLWMDGDTLKIDDKAVQTSSNISNKAFSGIGYVLPTGSYYLGNDVQLKYPLYFGDSEKRNVNLCLNGKTITAKGDFDAIILYRGSGYRVVFSLTDCQNTGKITHSNGKSGCGVYVFSNSRATFNMYKGSIDSNAGHVTTSNSTTTINGGGVSMNNNSGYSGDGGIFNMYGGTITNNSATNGGGVYMCNNGGNIFNLYGGSITGNTATDQGGGVYSASGEITMTGGSIDHNNASQGAGMYESGGSAAMSGGSITGNTATGKGGGVYVSKYGNFKISGSVQITGNTKESAANNVELAAGKTITIQSDLADGASIGVTTEKKPGTGDYSKVASGAEGYSLTEADANHFFSDVDHAYTIMRADNKLILTNTGDSTLHYHPICGETCAHENADGTFQHKDVYWEATSTLTNDMPAGYYYLTKNVTLTQSWRPKAGMVLDLNGHDIIMNANGYVISRGDEPGAFTLTDCMGGQGRYGKITHGNNYKGGGIQFASPLYHHYTMSFEMYGGSITGNTGSSPGVCLEDNSSYSITFNMYGGEITNNKNTSTTGSYKGGGVYVAAGNTFTMTGGKITGNQTATDGGGVYVEGQSNFIVSGDAQITGNSKKDGTTDNVYLQSVTNGTQKQASIQVKGALSNNASISVNAGTIDEGSYKIVAQGSEYRLTDSDLQRFTSDASYTPKLVDNRIAFTNGTPHEHPICGKTDCNDGHSNVLWNLLTYDAGTKQLKYGATTAKQETIPSLTGHYVYTLPAGHYYLAQNITLDGSISISGDVNICLNGHEISTNQYNRVFEITKYKLAVCDCSTSHSGKIRGNHNRIGEMQSLVVYLQSKASFDLYGGTICGGDYGVYEGGASSVTLFGGSITDNTNGVGGWDNPPIIIGGDAEVINNTMKNLCLRSNQVISIDDSLTQDARIGISTVTQPSANNNIQIATSATNTKLDYSKIFTSDATDQNYVVTKDAKGKLYLGIHQHNWQATAEGAQITFKCSADGCKLKSDFATTYTVTAPDLIYSGSEKVATVTTDDKYFDGLGLPTIPAITYQKLKETEYVGIEGAPKDVGTYRASITIENVTASVTYNIVSKEVANPTIEVTGTYTYDGIEKTPAVVVKDGETVISDREYRVSYADNINVGNATVTITDVAGGNYNVSGSTTFTIDKGTYTGTVGKTVNIIKNRVGEQTGTLTVADFFPEGPVPASARISDLATATSGIVAVRKSVDAYKGYILTYIAQDNITSTSDQTCAVTISSANYQDIQATLTFHPTDKETVTISGLTYTEKTYDGSAIQPTGTLKVSGDKVPVNELDVTYTGTGDTTYNSSDAPTDAGTYRVTYKVADSNENYTGEVTYPFTISQKAVTADMIRAIADETYTGNAITPHPIVTDGNTILTSGKDFDFSYGENINAGENTATLTITGKGNYAGTANQKFTIKPKDISSATIRLHNNSFIYNGITKKVEIASVTLGENTNTLTLTSPTDYDIKAGNTFINANDAITLTIAGKGNYTGTAATTWQITKARPELGNFDVSQNLSTPLTYDGTPKTVTAQPRNGVIGMGAVTVCYEGSNGTTYARSETAPANAGTYQVILSVVEGKNYTEAEITAGTLTIEKADLTVEDVTEFFEYTKTGEQTISLAELVPGATGYTLGTYTDVNGILTGDLTIDATGLMKFTLSALTIGNIDKKVTVPVTITSENYKDVTVNVTIYISPEYRIIDGAGSSWTQNTTGTVVIRGNGEYDRFRAVKVDGKVIAPANYDKKAGSTIITLKAEYLKTLATGSHTFAIVWNNGIAGTSFTVAANTSGNHSGNNNNNDSNHGSDNSGNNDSGNTAGTAANTAAAPAQELDKVPATGDASGIWLALFAVSLSGWAVMMVLKRKPGQKADPK